MRCWLCCHPMPVLWLTKAPCRNGLVLPVGWGTRPPLVTGRSGCCAPAKFLAKGLVPVAMGCKGAAAGGAGGGEWKGEFAAPSGSADWGLERAKGFVDCGVPASGGLVGAEMEPTSPGIPGCIPGGLAIMVDCRNGFVFCGSICWAPPVWRPGNDMGPPPAGNEAAESCGMGASDPGWKADCGEKPPKPAPVKAGCMACC